MRRHAIIIGAMKSGTSSLFRYLGQHPSICLSQPKELQFFSKSGFNKEPIDYLKNWKIKTHHKVLLEGSTNYTKYPSFSDVAYRIHTFEIDPKFIYIVRNPIHRLVSHYNHSIQRNRPCTILDSHLINTSNYNLQLNQYRKYFSKEDIFIVDFDDLILETQSTINQIFLFLGLKEFKIQSNKIHNRTKKIRLKSLFHPAKPLLKINELSVHEHAEIIRLLKPEMQIFGQEYNIDIKKWGF
ncbi:sulfotransferase family protein [Ekhidna sp.]|uniref:sulfotransferase family protein n=1 Tax=Ekhidna sp. TaxID=2608089 RepID=UPI003CCC3347